MKSFPRILVAFLMLLAATGAIAQVHAVNANVPFNFTVGERFLPAGQYTLFSPLANVVEIRSHDRRIVTFVVATHGFEEPAHGSRLEFKKYGQRYFLHRILCPISTGINMQIPAGKPEKRARSQEAKLDDGETVLLAARLNESSATEF